VNGTIASRKDSRTKKRDETAFLPVLATLEETLEVNESARDRLAQLRDLAAPASAAKLRIDSALGKLARADHLMRGALSEARKAGGRA
jgi:hypothetical protein